MNNNGRARSKNPERRSRIGSILILILVAVFAAALTVLTFVDNIPVGRNKVKDLHSFTSLIGKGIDLSGGYYVVLEPSESASSGESSDTGTLDRAMTILRERLDNKGYTEATVSVQDTNKIRVEIPEVDNAEEVLKYIANSGEITFQDSSGNVLVESENIKSAYVGYDNDAGYVVILNFTNEGISRFSDATKTVLDGSSSDKKLYIYLGEDLVSSPTVNSVITSASAQITGFDSYDAADAVASVIESGRLPITYSVTESRSISARLGENAINNSLIAGAIGLGVIFLIMLIFYRGMGLAADIALYIYVLLYIFLLAIVPNVQLTLPGIAGIILSIGMAVDANVVIFERIKQEYAQGKTYLSAVQSGFKRAVITVIDSNVTTILSAIVLWILCPGTIKGFAITLLIGIVLSMITSIFVTRWLLYVIAPLGNNKAKLFNLKRGEGFEDEDDPVSAKPRKIVLPKKVSLVGKFRYFIITSLVVILVGVGFMTFGGGMNIGVDFAGGAKIEVEVTDANVTKAEVKAAVDKAIEGKYQLFTDAIQESPANGYVTFEATLVYPKDVDESEFVQDVQGEVSSAIAENLGIDVENVKAYTVGATASGALLRSAILALVVAIIVMLIYIVVRFTFASALAAVCALVHDVLIMIALTTVFRIPVNSTFIAAVITIVGYSINATIIIFDRVREERKSTANAALSDADVANKSIAATLGRTILTTLTTLVMVIALAIFSVSAIREFIIPIIFGLIAGTFSSVFLASGFWVLFRKIGKKISDGKAKKRSYAGLQSK